MALNREIIESDDIRDVSVTIDKLVGTSGTSGQVLTNTGATTAPTWQTPAAGYTDEQAQDAVGTILGDTAEVDLIYDDATPTISASLKDTSIAATRMIGTGGTSGQLLTNTGAGAPTWQDAPDTGVTIAQVRNMITLRVI